MKGCSGRNASWRNPTARSGPPTPAAASSASRPTATQQIITQQRSEHFHDADSEASRYLEGTLPNGLAFARNGDILISNFGTDRLELMTRDGASNVLADRIDGAPIGKVNFVLRDSKDRIWITVSTRIKNWMHALRTDLADGFIARYDDGAFRIVADGFRFTNEIRFDAQRRVPLRRRDDRRLHHPPAHRRARRRRASGRSSARPGWARAPGRTASPSTATAISGARWSTRTSCSC